MLLLPGFVLPGAAVAGDPIAFSAKVKKVIAAKNKVALRDPATKKRFTVIVDGKSKLSGYGGIGDIKKGDKVAGKYEVSAKGLYVLLEMTKQ